MANNLILFENFYDKPGKVVDQDQGTPVAGNELENMADWRQGTAYRWINTGTGVASFRVNLGSGGTLEADCFAIAGHNFGTAGVDILIEAGDDGSIWSTALAATTITGDLPVMLRFTAGTGAKQWWRVSLAGSPFSVAAECGVMVLGREMVFEEASQPALDAYGSGATVENQFNDFGHHLGVNVRNLTKTFKIAHTDPGMTRDGFFNPSTGISFDDDFKPHAINNALPFFFAWNHDVDPTEVYLSHVDDYSYGNPFLFSTTRRQLTMTINGMREKT